MPMQILSEGKSLYMVEVLGIAPRISMAWYTLPLQSLANWNLYGAVILRTPPIGTAVEGCMLNIALLSVAPTRRSSPVSAVPGW